MALPTDRPTWIIVALFGVAYAVLLPALSAVGLEGDSLYEAPSCITGAVHGFIPHQSEAYLTKHTVS